MTVFVSSAHMTLSTPVFPELRAWAVEGHLDLDLLVGYDAGLGCRFVLSLEGQEQAVELKARYWAEALALFVRGMEVQGTNLLRPVPRRRHRRPDASRLILPSSRPGA